MLLGGAVVRTMLEKWPRTARGNAEFLQRQQVAMVQAQYLLLGLASWAASSGFLTLDLAGSISLHPEFVAIYARVS